MDSSLDRFLGAHDGESLNELWRRRAVFLVALAYGVVAILITVVTVIPYGIDLETLICPATLALYGSSVLIINRGGSINLAAIVLLVSSTLSAMGFVLVFGGVFGPGAVLFAGGPMAGALLLGYRGALAAGVFSTAVFLTLYFADATIQTSYDSVIYLVVLVMTIMATTVFSVAVARMTSTTLEAAMQARDEAHLASKAKSDFLANMSHEIRTPLNGVIALADALNEEDLSKDGQKKAQVIKSSGELLLRIINDVLDVSKIEAGAVEIENRPFDLEALARQVESLYKPMAAEKSLLLAVTVEDNLDTWRTGDEHRLAQVIGNLVSNAIKFTRQGSVNVSIQSQPDGVRMVVADTGHGMTPQQVEKVFNPFVQADSSTSRRFGGTGLGLSIVLGLTKRLGGEIDVETAPGRGTRVSVDLPLPRASLAGGKSVRSQPVQLSNAPDLSGCRILAVDDSPVNLMVLSSLLKSTNAALTQASDGQQGVQYADDQSFDVILMDISMPGMDGQEATEKIRAGSKFNQQVPIIATTAHALDHEVKALLEAGFDDHIAKPISSARLFDVITKHIAAAPGGAGELVSSRSLGAAS
ncbi:MAG: ATP-binding protein [Pseudomonadota bacterium]